MHEGAFRLLRALGDGRSNDRTQVAREAGEAPSVLRQVAAEYPKWFEWQDDGSVRLSRAGLVALSRELIERGRAGEVATDSLVSSLRDLAKERRLRRELDQVWATFETVAVRAKLLVESGDVQRGLALLGDDDLLASAIFTLGVERPITLFEIDGDLLSIQRRAAEREGWDLRPHEHDLRNPTPKKLHGRFGCVFTDPPYAVEGFRVFVSRALELLKPDGRLYVCFGYSRRATERGLQKQRVLSESGLLIDQVWPDFNAYEGADDLGGRSSLWRCLRTSQSRVLVPGHFDGAMYTRRSPE